MMKISVVIVNHNTPKLVRDCLASLEKNLSDLTMEIIVVNNGPERYLTDKESRAKVIDLDDNVGYGASNNRGAREATGDILWFLNSDTLIIDNSIKQAFEYVAKHRDAGIVTPLLYQDQSCHRLQVDFYARRQSLMTLFFRRAKPKINLENSDFIATDVVVGASMVTRRSIFQKLGGFDEKIFMYMEDDDLCYRARKAGYRVGVYTKARVVHLQGQSIRFNKQRKRLYYKSQNYFWRKHYGVISMWLMRMIRWPLKMTRQLTSR